MNCPSVQCPQTQASVHNAKETFILGFQRHQSQCAEPVNLSKATVPGYFIIVMMRLVFRSSCWLTLKLVRDTDPHCGDVWVDTRNSDLSHISQLPVSVGDYDAGYI